MSKLAFVVEPPADRLDRVVPRAHPDLSRRRARTLIAEGAVFLDGKRCKVASRHVPVGARLVVHLEVPDRAPDPRVLFEDEDIVVIDKPAGLSANPSETSAADSVVQRLAGTKLVHRLDKDTTGVMVLARSARATEALAHAFRDRHVDKTYRAVAMGTPPAGWVDAPIGADERRPRARAVRPDGKAARTEVVVRGHGGDLSALELGLETGRTHQIRVHLGHLGTPILGDTLYGGKVAAQGPAGPVRAPRPLLHAARLGFTLLGTEHRFEAPLPADMAALWDALVVPSDA